MAELDLSINLLQHGIRRQVYVVPLARNTREILLGSEKTPEYITQTVRQITDYWRKRWAAPRARRQHGWQDWHPDEAIDDLRRLYSLAHQNGALPCH